LPEIELNGVTIHYVVEGAGPDAILFIHGLGENLESWRSQITYFSDSCKTIAIDLRGHGKSGTSKKRIGMDDFADDAIGLLNHLGVTKAHFCGLSLGGLVIFQTYKKRPDLFKSMTLVGCRPQFPPAQTAALESMSMSIIGEEVATFALAANASDALRAEVAKMTADTNKDAYLQSAAATSMLSYLDLLPEVKAPTLIIVGDLDIVAPPDSAELMHKNIRDSALKIMRGVGHLPNRESPEEFNSALKEFLDSLQR
jgi:3-oxoadipate enol-lactonase